MLMFLLPPFAGLVSKLRRMESALVHASFLTTCTIPRKETFSFALRLTVDATSSSLSPSQMPEDLSQMASVDHVLDPESSLEEIVLLYLTGTSVKLLLRTSTTKQLSVCQHPCPMLIVCMMVVPLDVSFFVPMIVQFSSRSKVVV